MGHFLLQLPHHKHSTALKVQPHTVQEMLNSVIKIKSIFNKTNTYNILMIVLTIILKLEATNTPKLSLVKLTSKEII